MAKLRKFLFENTSLRQTVAKNTLWLSIGEITSRLVRAGLIIYAARILGTEGYGVFSYALNVAAFFSIFADVGLSGLMTREAVKKPERIKEYFSTAFILKLVLAAATTGIMLLAAPAFTRVKEALPLLPLIAFLPAFDTLRGFGFAITRAENRMELEAILNVITNVLITALGVAALIIRPAPFYLTMAYTAGSGIGFILLVAVLWGQFRDSFKYFRKELLRPLLAAAWPFAIMSILGGFMINIDVIILNWFRSAHELGLYGASQRPVLLMYILPGFIAMALFPIMSRLAGEEGRERFRAILEKALRVSMAVALPLAVGGIIVGEELIKLLFGAAYLDAVPAFKILMLTTLLIFPGTIIGNAIFAYDRQKIFIVSAAGGAVLNAVLDVILIPPYGIAGSAVATVIAQGFTNGWNWRKMRRINNFKVLPQLKKVAAATALMGIFTATLTALGAPILITVPLAIAVYAGTLIILKEPLLHEFRSLLS
ncbi:MAG: flippase [Parcubacteria group bacterium]|nr:flippase [Parcubacteria group bacterium]